jgi:mevalonate kinase
MQKFHSNGKLLLTGEYVVLDGATALAIPTKYGQSLEVSVSEKEGIQWKSFDENGTVWFEDCFDLKNFGSKKKQDTISKTLSKILFEAKVLNPGFLANNDGILVETRLDFPRHWGLGTSSTLINNIAQWAEIDAFALLANSFGGSGYDIAAAKSVTPILYKLTSGGPEFLKTTLPWNFTESLFFVYLNKKQDSKEGIARYRKTSVPKKTLEEISEISSALSKCRSLSSFENLLEKHEALISEIIGLPSIKEKIFSDYPNTIKSLGAWGGDFVLATGGEREREYFRTKGFETVIGFSEMIKIPL